MNASLLGGPSTPWMALFIRSILAIGGPIVIKSGLDDGTLEKSRELLKYYSAYLWRFSMINLQKRISHGLNVLQFYTTKEWHFRNTNYKSLRTRITAADNDTFSTDPSQLDPEEYLKNYVLGTRKFCCKEDPANLPRARKLHKILTSYAAS